MDMTGSKTEATASSANCDCAGSSHKAVPPEADQLTRVAKALSDPVRAALPAVLAEGREYCGLPAAETSASIDTPFRAPDPRAARSTSAR